MNAPHWNSVSFYIKRLLVFVYSIYPGNSIKPLNDLITKPETTHNFRKSLNVEVHRPRTAVGRHNLRNKSPAMPAIYTDCFKNTFFNRIFFKCDVAL